MEAGQAGGDLGLEDRGAVGVGGSGGFAPEGTADHATRRACFESHLDLREERLEVTATRQQCPRHWNQRVHFLAGVEPDIAIRLKGWIDRERKLQQMRVGSRELAGGFEDNTAPVAWS